MDTTCRKPGLHSYPIRLAEALAEALGERQELYITGGAVRDWLLGRPSRDLDFTVPAGGIAFARRLAAVLHGSLVILDEGHDLARVVWQDLVLDCGGWREGATTIVEDLKRRDFTINALAVALTVQGGRCRQQPELIDPVGGWRDLQAGIIRVVYPGALAADPLRLLRAYRFLATLERPASAEAADGEQGGWRLAAATEDLIKTASDRHNLAGVAAERLRAELDAILVAPRGAAALRGMAAAGLLFAVVPELAAGQGLAQPASHHLDVTGHCLETVACLRAVVAAPEVYFPRDDSPLRTYLAAAAWPDRRCTLFWAALLHDLGKPAACQWRRDRVTFYNHDQLGAELCQQLGRRLRFSRRRLNLLAKLVGHHMWPFHLNNARARQGITPRAALRLWRAVGEDLPGLFLLAMADSLAGRGGGKPPDMEKQLAALYSEVNRLVRQRLEPVLRRPPLLNGHDLQRWCGLSPGPLFKEILDGLQQAQVAGEVRDREQALAWVARFYGQARR
ncbi:MAG: HDIG domain-containing protein [Desulfurivibrio sp.]|nr:HDIG domain-containing protein [Desulfurivibrio sp.]